MYDVNVTVRDCIGARIHQQRHTTLKCSFVRTVLKGWENDPADLSHGQSVYIPLWNCMMLDMLLLYELNAFFNPFRAEAFSRKSFFLYTCL